MIDKHCYHKWQQIKARSSFFSAEHPTQIHINFKVMFKEKAKPKMTFFQRLKKISLIANIRKDKN